MTSTMRNFGPTHLILLVLSSALTNGQEKKELLIDVSSRSANISLEKFWASTGFTPNRYFYDRDTATRLFRQDTLQNLALIGSLPNGAIDQVRIHWLLDLVDKKPDGSYDFQKLDRLLDFLWSYDLNPGFEMMGLPHGDTATTTVDWFKLARDLANRYIERYGLGLVSAWNFELWNEPDHASGNGMNMTVDEYLAYYDSVSAGLWEASPEIQLGGPGGSCRPPKMMQHCYGLLDHVRADGKRLDYVSFHLKGDQLAENELNIIPVLAEKLGSGPQTVKIYNDEGDPLVGWYKQEPWRGDTRYAVKELNNIIDAKKLLIDSKGFNYKMLSNDNAFLNDLGSNQPFDQRTLLARFQSSQSTNQSIVLVPKPVYRLTSMLALLGNTSLHVAETGDDVTNELGVLATYQEDKGYKVVSAVISNNCSFNGTLHLTLVNQTQEQMKMRPVYVVWTLAQKATNPRKTWKAMNRPKILSDEQANGLIQSSQLLRSEAKAFEEDGIALDFPKMCQIALVQICMPITTTSSGGHIGQPHRLQFFQVTDSHLLITWRFGQSASCLMEFHVEFSSNGRTFQRINEEHKDISNFFDFFSSDSGKTPSGWFRVQAVDVFGNRGPYSVPQFYFNTGDRIPSRNSISTPEE